MKAMAKGQFDVDKAMGTWFLVEDGVDIDKKENFKRILWRHRQGILNKQLDCYANTIWFGSEIDKLLTNINTVFGRATNGKLWNTIAAYLMGLKAKELIGRKRAIGGPFFTEIQTAGEKDFVLFNRLQCGADHLFDQAFVSNPSGGVYMEGLKIEHSSLMRHLEFLAGEVLVHNVTNRGSNKSLDWFYSMSEYIDLLSDLEANTAEGLIQILSQDQESATYQFVVVIVAVAVSFVVCSLLIGLYIYQANKLMMKVQLFTERLEKKTRELKIEKHKTDTILFQILPVSIANRLKKNEIIEPEHYDQVTVYFSDIMGFTSLSGKCTPMEVIQLLNELYTKFDEIIERYDVYKVETIGDAYMVASGLPKRIAHKHSSEMATMGPCVAGIVGTKMPRYCLFGDTVNTASRMESSGSALQIHISDATERHLKRHFPTEFQIIPRGTVKVKGKGDMRTFWLLGKVNFPYRINLEEACEKVEKSSYWKDDEFDTISFGGEFDTISIAEL